MEDTIVAISTALAPAAIAVVRLSGPRAIEVSDGVVRLRSGSVATLPSNVVRTAEVYDGSELVDQALVTVMRAPSSYTGEDVVEISCHGSTLIARKIVELCLRHGARLAEPGEFTKRAFLNGKMDLTQAEAVMDMISAKTNRARAAACRVLQGGLSRSLESVRASLVEALAYVEAHIDFPEEDIGHEEVNFVRDRLVHVMAEVDSLLATAREGRILREGLRVAIIGRPNVGKSSLLNALTNSERAIVTPVAGTTRDLLEESVNIRGIPIVLVDTAGLRRARGKVEEIGIERTRAAISSSDLILHVVDNSKPAHRGDFEIHASYFGMAVPAVLVLNKCDLPERFTIPKTFNGIPAVRVSCRSGAGLKELCDLIETQAGMTHDAESQLEATINQRHEKLLNDAAVAMRDAKEHLQSGGLDEILAQYLRRALDSVGQIIGKVTTDDLLDSIFSRFCIGK